MAEGPFRLNFVMSATGVGDLPADRGARLPSSVGRTWASPSLINAMANQKQLAKVSKDAGAGPSLLNLFEFGDGTTLMDLPGYGFAKVPGRVRSTWPAMIEGYLLERDGLNTVMTLIDAEIRAHGRSDVTTLEWLAAHDLPTRIVATKHDKVKPSVRDKTPVENWPRAAA